MKGKRLKDYLSSREASEKLGISKEGLRYLIEKGEINPIFYVDNYYLIPETTVKDFLKKRKSENLEDNRYKVK